MAGTPFDALNTELDVIDSDEASLASELSTDVPIITAALLAAGSIAPAVANAVARLTKNATAIVNAQASLHGAVVPAPPAPPAVTVAPASLALSLSTQPTATFHVSESNGNTGFTPTVADPTIASVAAGPAPGDFVVTAIAVGQTTVAFSDGAATPSVQSGTVVVAA
jgi:hypothetical protein